jgi:hypothetical protein
MNTWTNRGKTRLADGTYDAGNLTLALLTATPTEAAALDWNTEADLVDEVTTGAVASYARAAMSTATIAEDDTANESTIDFADTSFGTLEVGATVTCTAALDLTSDEVMWVAETATPTPTSGDTFTIVWPANGAAAIVQPA